VTFLPSNSKSPFLPTTQVFPEDESQRLIVLTDNYTSLAQNINQREIGTFETIEQLNGQQFFNATDPEKKRFAYRKVFVVGAIAAGATSTIAHGITAANTTTTFTHIYGTVRTATIDNRPIPYSSATAVNLQIEVNVDATNINIINGAAAPAITSGIVVLEFIKN